MRSNKKTVFITGASGFIGANLTRRLIEKGFTIHAALKKTSDLWRLFEVKEKINIHYVDLSDKNKLSTLLLKIKPEFIFHLAAHGAYPSQTEIPKIIETNINGTLNLLVASKKIDYKMLVVTGTSSEYGFKSIPAKETDTLSPISFYAASKASATLLSMVFANTYKKPIVIIRPYSPYGPYEEESRLIPTIIKSLMKNKNIYLTPGNQRRDFIYIDDLIDAYIKALGLSNKTRGEIFNIGTGIEYSNDEVVKTLFKVTGKKVPIKKGEFPKRMWDTNHWVGDITKANKYLKWRPKYTLEEGLKKTYLWFEKNEKI